MSPTRDGNVLNWASDLDPNALDQANVTASMPFVEGHLALMPDAHVGFGATIGSVIPTRGAVIPSAVGVDIGCVDADTEFLSPTGWKRISEYAGERVAQYHPDTGMAEFVAPLAYIRRPQDTFLHFHTKYGVDQMLTPDHRVLCWKVTGRDRRRVQEVISAAEFAVDHERLAQGRKVEFETAFSPVIHSALPFDDAQLRAQVMVMADGHVSAAGRCILNFTKERKVDRARKLLHDIQTPFTDRLQSDGRTVLRFTPPSTTKSYGDWYAASLSQLQVIVDECLHWDGNLTDRVFYTRDRASADFMHYAFAATGHRSVLRSDNRDGVVDYRVYAHMQSRVGMGGTPKTPIVEVPSPDGMAYCFTVRSGFLVLRRGGNIFTTGNCGMIAVECPFTSDVLPDSLDNLHGAISDVVPAGVGRGHDTARRAEILLDDRAEDLNQKQANAAAKQLGSLGAGNHFVEVCLDERDRVWVVLHSGSRGVGNQLATGHIDEAKGLMREWFIDLPDPDLAYLVEGTAAFEAYIRHMLWAQDYAFANRDEMMDAVLIQLAGAIGYDFDESRRINCHHNFTVMENHKGRNLWITRKGAIRAREGDLGVIPGSMGTASYIVSGKGNEASYTSCSHGAGRRMSRGQARRSLDPEGLTEAMVGKAWNHDAKTLIDEDPRAYKDIDQVMADQSDLVAVEHTLSQVLNYKGA